MSVKINLKDNQLSLIRHLAQFESLDYLSCLYLLDTEKQTDRVKLSYAFRPLTKHKYLKKYKDGSVRILAKGRALFPDVKTLVTIGGGNGSVWRVNLISKTAMCLREIGIHSVESPEQSENACFIPSTCWRKIRKGILSTTRFTGMLFLHEHRLAVYDIGDGTMEWQLRAERSLFYTNYHEMDTRATGMLLICHDDKRAEVGKRIIRNTMWHRKQLIGLNKVSNRDRPVTYVHAPIRLTSQYEHVYLTTPLMLNDSLREISHESEHISKVQNNCPKCHDPSAGDFEHWPYCYFINTTTDLLKYVYYFGAARTKMTIGEASSSELKYALILPQHDFDIVDMYPDILELEGMKFFEYKPDANT